MRRGPRELIAEAARRKVFRTTGVYLVAVWGISQGAAELGPLFGAPEWLLRAGFIGALGLVPVVVLLAWFFEIGRSGITRDTEDLRSQRAADEKDLASMTTMLGADAGVGGVIVRWTDAGGENATLFTDEFLVGRGHDCRVRFYDPLVSRRHARVYFEDDGWQIEDLGSRNGTQLGSEKVDRAALATGSAARNEIRVNEAGPPLQLEVVSPGQALQEAQKRHLGAPVMAHIRSDPPDTSAGGSGSRLLQPRRTQ